MAILSEDINRSSMEVETILKPELNAICGVKLLDVYVPRYILLLVPGVNVYNVNVNSEGFGYNREQETVGISSWSH